MSTSKKVEEIEASRIVLRSPNGKIHACLDASSDDAFFLDLFGQKEARLSLCIDTDGNPKMNFTAQNGRAGVSIGISDDLGAGLTVSDSEGRPVCFIFTPEDGIPRIKLFQATSPKTSREFWATPVPENDEG